MAKQPTRVPTVPQIKPRKPARSLAAITHVKVSALKASKRAVNRKAAPAVVNVVHPNHRRQA